MPNDADVVLTNREVLMYSAAMLKNLAAMIEAVHNPMLAGLLSLAANEARLAANDAALTGVKLSGGTCALHNRKRQRRSQPIGAGC